MASTTLDSPQASLWEIFSTWLVLGIQSFGGGTSTFYLVHQACMTKGWLREDEFIRTWALAQISPGINLIKLTVMVGHKLRGWPGLFSAAAGLLLPSASATVLMTAGFGLIRKQPLVQSAMRGILPATIGLSLAMAVQMAQPLMERSYKEGPARLSSAIVIITTATLALAWWNVSPVIILLLSGAVTVTVMALVPAKQAAP